MGNEPRKTKAGTAKTVFMIERCKGCGLCVIHCPKKYLEISDEMNQKGYQYVGNTNEEDCLACGLCALMCPDSVIEVYK